MRTVTSRASVVFPDPGSPEISIIIICDADRESRAPCGIGQPLFRNLLSSPGVGEAPIKQLMGKPFYLRFDFWLKTRDNIHAEFEANLFQYKMNVFFTSLHQSMGQDC